MKIHAIAGVAGFVLLLALASSSGAVPAGTIVPDKDVTPLNPVGAADRAKNGPSRLATPPNDVGAADDPDQTTAPLENMAAPAPVPPGR